MKIVFNMINIISLNLMTDLQVLAVKNSFTPNFSPLDFAMEINGFHVLCILLEFI